MTHARPLVTARIRRPSLSLVALVAHLAVVLPLAYVLNIWQDEAYTLATTSGSLAFAFHQALAFEQNAPLYFLLLTAWRHLGDSIFFLRLPSVAFAATAVALVPAIARRYLPSVNPGYVTLVAAWNPFIIWAALEMRVYALVILMSAILLVTFFDAFLSSKPSLARTAAYAGCVAIALYVQFYLGFLVAAQGLTLAIYRPRAIPRFAAGCAAAAIAFAPMLIVVPAQVANFATGFARPTLLRSVAVLVEICMRYALPLAFRHAAVAYALLLAAAATALVLGRRRLQRAGDGIALVMTGAAAALFALGAYAAGVHVLERHAASLYLLVAASVFSVLTFVRLPLRPSLMRTWCCAAAIASTAVLTLTYAHLAKPGDWIRVTAYLAQHERPGEPIAVFQAENALPFTYYYRGPNRIVAIPRGVNFRRYDVRDFVIRDKSMAQRVLPQDPRIWLITTDNCTSGGLDFGCPFLSQAVANRYAVASDAAFYGSRVRLLVRKDVGG